MSINPAVRASDADREHVASALREHTAEGRLTLDEMGERMDAAYAARTLGDLQRLVADLPGSLDLPAVARTAPPERSTGVRRGEWLRARWAVYCSVVLLCVLIWLGTSLAAGSVSYFWPVWVIGPWGAVLLAKTIKMRQLALVAARRQ